MTPTQEAINEARGLLVMFERMKSTHPVELSQDKIRLILTAAEEAEGLRADAERWRFGVAQGFPMHCLTPRRESKSHWSHYGDKGMVAHDSAEAAIDAARALTAPQEGK